MKLATTTDRAKKHFFSESFELEQLAAARRQKAVQIIGLLKPFLIEKKIESALSIGSSYCLIEDDIKKTLMPEAQFVCTDLDIKALHHFSQPGLTKQVNSATELDFPDNSFDFIMAHQVLEHINTYPDVLKSFDRLCKPGGIIYINVPNPLSPMIGKLPDGKWPDSFFSYLFKHNLRKINRDFMTNTEKYHTGFTKNFLKKAMRNYTMHDLRKPRLKQEVSNKLIYKLIDLFPSLLLFLFIETNIWCLVKRDNH